MNKRGNEMETKEERVISQKPLSALVDAALTIEKLRVQSQVRQSHLKLQDKDDPETNELHKRILDLESYVDGRVAKLLLSHPAYPWFSKVKGIGKENIGKIVALVDIEKASTISALWKFCGYAVENGHSMKRVKGGGKLAYNSQLRTMCWRLGSSLLRAKGVFYDYYIKEKDKYVSKYEGAGIKIVPALSLPKVDGKKQEGDGYISEGHVHNQALRKMIKLFLSCLWLTWREAEGLPITKPYAIGQLGHDSFIDPWNMVDK